MLSVLSDVVAVDVDVDDGSLALSSPILVPAGMVVRAESKKTC